MFIQTETTPNPKTLKFLPGFEVLAGGTASFANAEAGQASPLATALFGVNHVEAVFLGQDFITVTKSDAVDWSVLKPHVLTTIMEFFISGQAVMGNAEPAKKEKKQAKAEDAELVKQIIELIDTRVRPAVAEDGGDIIFDSFEDGVVYLELHGSCSGCPSSTITLKNGIENMLKHYVPEVERVEAIN